MTEELNEDHRRDALPVSVYIRPLLRLLAMAALLFIPAGTLAWPEGLVYLAMYACWSAVTTILLARRSPALLRLRELERPSSPYAWDRFFSSAAGTLLIFMLFICGADRPRGVILSGFHWEPFLVIAAAYVLAAWTLLSNPHAVGAVLLREGQSASAAGPYGKVRHPLYLASVFFFLATPGALGSLYAFIPALLLVAATVARTWLEDRLLRRELPGYADYSVRVPYRLLPGIW